LKNGTCSSLVGSISPSAGVDETCAIDLLTPAAAISNANISQEFLNNPNLKFGYVEEPIAFVALSLLNTTEFQKNYIQFDSVTQLFQALDNKTIDVVLEPLTVLRSVREGLSIYPFFTGLVHTIASVPE